MKYAYNSVGISQNYILSHRDITPNNVLRKLRKSDTIPN